MGFCKRNSADKFSKVPTKDKIKQNEIDRGLPAQRALSLFARQLLLSDLFKTSVIRIPLHLLFLYQKNDQILLACHSLRLFKTLVIQMMYTKSFKSKPFGFLEVSNFFISVKSLLTETTIWARMSKNLGFRTLYTDSELDST